MPVFLEYWTLDLGEGGIYQILAHVYLEHKRRPNLTMVKIQIMERRPLGEYNLLA
mgnify:CR=1